MASCARPMSTLGTETFVVAMEPRVERPAYRSGSRRPARARRLAADCREQRAGDAVGRVALVGVELDGDAAVQTRRVGHVGVFRMVRVDAVGVVCRDKEALRKHSQIPFLIQPQRKRDAPERIGKQARRCALLRLAADLLIVERAEDRHAARGLRCQKALEQTEHAAEIVQPRGENKLVFAPKHVPRVRTYRLRSSPSTSSSCTPAALATTLRKLPEASCIP